MQGAMNSLQLMKLMRVKNKPRRLIRAINFSSFQSVMKRRNEIERNVTHDEAEVAKAGPVNQLISTQLHEVN